MAGPISRESDKFMLRLPDGWRDVIKRAADEGGRSMNGEILLRLSSTFEFDSVSDYRRFHVEQAKAGVPEMIPAFATIERMKDDLVEQIAQRVVGLLKENDNKI